MNIFINLLHGDTLFTAFFFPSLNIHARDSIKLLLIQSLLLPLQNQSTALHIQDFTFKECQAYLRSKV